jgi:hypothetical protein
MTRLGALNSLAHMSSWRGKSAQEQLKPFFSTINGDKTTLRLQYTTFSLSQLFQDMTSS